MSVRAPRGHPRLIALVCSRCGRDYHVKPHRSETSKYCSFECTKLAKGCENCGQLITKRPGRRRFCSRSCASAFMVGPKASVWKGGVAPRLLSSRWRRAVLKRDEFTCRNCGAIGVTLHAHHIKPWADYPALRHEVSNGLTVCVSCHEIIHGRKIAKQKRYAWRCIECDARCSWGCMRCAKCDVINRKTRRRRPNGTIAPVPVESSCRALARPRYDD